MASENPAASTMESSEVEAPTMSQVSESSFSSPTVARTKSAKSDAGLPPFYLVFLRVCVCCHVWCVMLFACSDCGFVRCRESCSVEAEQGCDAAGEDNGRALAFHSCEVEDSSH